MGNFPRVTLSLAFFVLMASSLFAQEKLTGNWEGHIEVMGQQLRIITHFTQTNSGFVGTIDIPQQGASGLTLQDIAVTTEDSVSFAFFAGTGLAKFRGAFENDSTIAGDYIQSGRSYPFELQSQSEVAEAEQPMKEKKTDQKDKTYQQEELIIDSDSVSIAGTLTWPESTQANHLVIMISGSGAQDRDETMSPISNFKPFALLADSLTKNGIATLRYDDRGVGKSTGNFTNATLQVLTSDVKAIVNSLTNHPNHNFSQVTLLGHSQGGIVAGKAATQYSDIDNIILMASTGVPLHKVIRFQIRQKFEEAGIDSELVQRESTVREKLMEAIVKNKDIVEAKKEYRNIFRKIQVAAGADSAQASDLADQQVKALPHVFRSPQMKSLLYYDPTEDLKEIDIPLLVLFGGKDTQVTVEMNKDPIVQALKTAGVDYQIKVFENANHPFQPATTGKVQEYATLPKQFVDGFTSTISEWIKNQ